MACRFLGCATDRERGCGAMLVFAFAWMTGCESGGKVFSRPRQLTLGNELERLVFLSGLLEYLGHAVFRVEIIRVVLHHCGQLDDQER